MQTGAEQSAVWKDREAFARDVVGRCARIVEAIADGELALAELIAVDLEDDARRVAAEGSA
jgi:hypothetical protein